jgi:chondroitin 4-sulfotransferase 11
VEPSPAILLEAYGAVYIEIAKVASSSLKVVFARLLGLDLAAVNDNPHLLSFPSPGSRNFTHGRLFPRLYTFAFVRNPWDRLVSCYRDKIGGEVADFTSISGSGVAHCLAGSDVFTASMDFEAFLNAVATIPDEDADEHFRSQHCSVTNADGEIAVDFLGRYENLSSDLARVAEKIGLPSDIRLPQLQSNPIRIVYSEFYTARTRDLVARRFAKDIALFGYQFENR